MRSRPSKAGNLHALAHLTGEHPELARTTVLRQNGQTLTLLHVATDWPGHFPNGPKTVAALIEAGADVNAYCDGANKQTPLHWAASSNDVEVLDVLLDAGVEIEAPGAFHGTMARSITRSGSDNGRQPIAW